jgi:L-ascorbate metabolism protein UlaG (beta-lactamase superfamily)
MLIFFISLPVFFLIVFLFMQQKSFGQKPLKANLIKSANYKNGKFQNIEKTNVMLEEANFWKMSKMFFAKHPNTSPDSALPTIKTDLKILDNDKVEIVWFGHSSYLIKIDSFTILVDPFLSKRASPVSWAGVKTFEGTNIYTAEDFPKIDVLLTTHDHYDHLDYKTILQLQSKTKKYVTPIAVGGHLAQWGVPVNDITELDLWDSVDVSPEIKIIATPARHFSGRGFKRDQTLWASYVIVTPKYKIYVGGDSGYGKHFAEIGAKYGPFDLALLESGQYGKYWPNIHMLPEETVKAAADLQAKVLMPVHWGRFKLSVHPWTEPITRVINEANKNNIKVTTPMIGEKVVFGESFPNQKWW